MKNLISVIVPVYNVEKYVLKCLESIKNQTYLNLEIIIVDDGSTDSSGNICDDFCKTEKRARMYHKKNGGLSSARNFGIKKAKGDLITFIDSDDYIDKDYISEMFGVMYEGVDVAICGYNNVVPDRAEMSGKEAAIRLLTRQENIDIVAWNKLYRKKIFEENNISFPDKVKHEDTLTTYKILGKAKRVVYVPKALYFYVERKESITQSEKLEERLEMRERAAREAIVYFAHDKELKQAAEISLLWAKYNYLNYAIKGKIDKRNEKKALNWLKDNVEGYTNNKYLSKKLKIYNTISTRFNGMLYRLIKMF